MVRARYRHAPQGTGHVTGPGEAQRAEAAAERQVEAIKLLLWLNDREVLDLLNAFEDRNDAAITRLLPVVKARYQDEWQMLGRTIMAARGRWPGRRRR